MEEGDEWKQQGERGWNNPVKISRHEFSSIFQAFYESVLRGVAQKNESIDRSALEMTLSELDWKIEDPNFKKMPLQVQHAYQRLKELSVALKEASDIDVANFQDALYTVFLQGINCHTYGSEISRGKDGIYFGRNPCRETQFKMNSALRQAEERKGNSKLLDALKGMFDACRKCPYK